jgi:hypothetical protein
MIGIIIATARLNHQYKSGVNGSGSNLLYRESIGGCGIILSLPTVEDGEAGSDSTVVAFREAGFLAPKKKKNVKVFWSFLNANDCLLFRIATFTKTLS